MATMTSTILKTGKKVPPNTTLVATPPPAQKSSENLQKSDKPSTTPTLQTLQSSLTFIQETMLAMQEKLFNNHSELKTDIHTLDAKMTEIQASISSNENRIQNVEQRMDQNEKKLDTVDQTLMLQNKEITDSLIQMEMDKASFYLRFQNIIEEKEEDLGDKMAELIADILQRDKQEIIRELDEIYRVQTNYVRRNRLPREVHVRFARKKLRDIVLNIAREEQIIFRGKEVNILKQIPKRVREKRRNYNFLTNFLNRRKIIFRWLLPEGLLISWQGRKIKIDNPTAAQDFLDQIKGEGEDLSSKEEVETANVEEDSLPDQSSKEELEDEKEKEGREELEDKGKKTRPVRAVTLKKN